MLILWQDSANIIYQKHRPAVLWPNNMFIVDIYNNCIKLSAVNGCLLILSASVITEEPYRTVPRTIESYLRTSCYRSHRAFVCAYIHLLRTVRVLQQRGQPQVV